MVESEPARFFRPPTSASGAFSGWLGAYLDGPGNDRVDWQEVASLLEDAFRVVAPNALVARLDGHQHRASAPAADRPDRHQFRTELWRHTGETAWHVVTLPADIADEIEDVAVSTRRGFGSVRVTATVGTTTWSTSVFPDSASKSFVLPIKKQVRVGEDLHAGDRVDVTIALIDPTAVPR